MTGTLDSMHHVAIEVRDIAESVAWYCGEFCCEVVYQDATWAFLKFSNIHLALVLPGHHPPHIAFTSAKATVHPGLKPHRDGTRSVYISDISGNSVELMDPTSL
ncbi:MAG: VOC family protein [Planctomycetaceae bacterium]|jgi:catechol 2,3-dioxygenase-like lactoylglutathione lyase family enzyme